VLEGLRVVELSLLAPSAVGMHLADLGAEVIKVEDPWLGDYVRDMGKATNEEASPRHRHWNRGKRSLTIDLRKDAGIEVFEKLITRSHVVIEGLRPGSLDRRGVGYARLRELNPRLVFLSLSGFGQTGPYRSLASHGPGFEAYAGLAKPAVSQNGLPRIPKLQGPSVGIQLGPLMGAFAILAAVIRSHSTGEGCYLDVAEGDVAAYWLAESIDEAADERFRREQGTPERDVTSGLPEGDTDIFERSARCQYYETSDGRYVLFMALERKFFERFAESVDRPDLLSRFTSDREIEFGSEELRRELVEIFQSRTLEEWVEFFDTANVPGIPVNVGGQILEDPHFVVRTRWLDGGVHGSPMMAIPILADPPLPAPGRAPTLGQQTVEVLQDVLDYDSDGVDKLYESGALGSLPS
jgi:crotonobetainyl-CoA:carnitine CoA-transferase CaiB-like acyl-CoA transferase